MYKRISGFMFPLLTIALIGTVIWATQVNDKKNVVMIKAENQYQRAFHDLTYHIEHLHRELGNALAVNSTSQGFHRKCLINAWRLTSEARASIDQLPLALLPFDKTEQLLSKISKFSYQTAVRDLAKEPLSEEEMNTLRTLVDQSHQISEELNNIQSLVIEQNLRWLDVELALGGGDEPQDNSIIDGFKTVDQTVSEYTEAGWGPSVMNMFDDGGLRKIEGKEYSEYEIKEKALAFLGYPDATNVEIATYSRDPKFETYSVSVAKPQSDETVQLEYTKQGGKLLWMMNERQIGPESTVDLEQALELAQQFLKDRDYGDSSVINTNKFGQVVYLTMANMENDVIIYPEKFAVYVAMDRGEVIGFQASDYLSDQQERDIPPAGLSLAEAKQKLNPSFDISDHRLAIIENEMDEDVLCYQFVGTIHDQQYRIFINADTGLEEKLEQLQ